MGGIFSMDGPLFTGINKLVDTVFLSLLWVLFSIPLFTIGAATSAVYATANKTLRHERGYVFAQFWASFKSCFKQGTLAWLICVAVAAIVILDIRAINFVLQGTAGMLYKFVFIFISLVLMLLMQFLFPYIARFTSPFKNVIKNSMIMAIRHLPWTILLLVFSVICVLACYILPILMFVIPAIWGIVSSLIIERIFRRYMSEEDKAKEEKLNSRHPQ